MTARIGRWGAVLLACVAGGAPVLAQHGTPSRAFDRLFTPEGSANHMFVQIFHGEDSAVGISEEQARRSGVATGPFLGLTPSLSLGGSTSRQQLTATSAMRRYLDTGRFSVVDTRVGFSAAFTRRHVGARLQQSVWYTPYQTAGGLLGVPTRDGTTVPTPERAGDDRSVTTSLTTFDLGQQISRSVLLSASYGLQYQHFGATSNPIDNQVDRQLHHVSGRVSRQLGRYTVLFAGYGTRLAVGADPNPISGAPPLQAHDLAIGIDRLQQLTLLRRTTVQFSTGSTIADTAEGRRFFVTGTGLLRHDLSRTWFAGLAVRRGITYVDGVRDPVFAHSISGSIEGSLGSRIDGLAQIGYSRGDVGLAAVSNGFSAYFGSLRLRALLTKRLSLYGEYVRYDQNFESGSSFAQSFMPVVTRRGLRAGIMLNVPFQNSRGVR